MNHSLSLHHQQQVASPVKSTHSSQREGRDDEEEDWFSTAEGSDDQHSTTPTHKTNGTSATARNPPASSSVRRSMSSEKGKEKQVDVVSDVDHSSDSPPPSPIPPTVTSDDDTLIRENDPSGSIRTNSVLGLQLRAGPSRPPPLQDAPRNASSWHHRDQDPSESSEIPAVNIIPTSPPPPDRSTTPRMSTNSLDIPSSPTSQSFQSDAQARNRRRETLSSTTLSDRERRSNRRRSLDPRAGGKRLSGFISNLFHNRDREASSSSIPNTTTHPVTQPSVSHPSPSPTLESPLIEAPITPPPSLPPPTLQDLGLKFTSITSSITQSQFTHAPATGTFLAPHYLLLCHSQGLDVLPLVGPPAPYPYALIRRVAFKSVLVMEERGVLVAIAGRREGVRVYALEEVKKAVEWRMEVELVREREKHDGPPIIGSSGRQKKASSLTVLGRASEGGVVEQAAPRTISNIPSSQPLTKVESSESDVNGHSTDPSNSSMTSVPQSPPRTITRRQSLPISPPPLYASLSSPQRGEVEEPQVQDVPTSDVAVTSTPRLGTRTSMNSLLSIPSPSRTVAGATTRQRNASITTISPGNAARMCEDEKGKGREDDERMEWKQADRHHDDSDEEALDPVAAGPSGSAALDERTSAIRPRAEDDEHEPEQESRAGPAERRMSVRSISTRPPRAVDPDESPIPTPQIDEMASQEDTMSTTPITNSPVMNSMAEFGVRPVTTTAPAPTLLSMRQALQTVVPPPTLPGGNRPGRLQLSPRPARAIRDPVGGDESGIETPEEPYISFAQMLMESRIPPVPPLPPMPNEQTPSSPPGSPTSSNGAHGGGGGKKRRRRWSVMNGVLRATNPSVSSSSAAIASTTDLNHHHHLHTPPPTMETHPAESSTSAISNMTGTTQTSETVSVSDRSSFTHGHGSGMGVGGPSSIVSSPTTATTPGAMRGPTPSASTTSLGRFSGSGMNSSSRLNGMTPRSSTRDPNHHQRQTIQTIDRIFAPNDPPVSPIVHDTTPASAPPSRSTHRFLPKLFTALGRRGSGNVRRSASSGPRRRVATEGDGAAGGAGMAVNGTPTESEAENASGEGNHASAAGPIVAPTTTTVAAVQSMAPKLEYVKLPGTKGALAIKAVETPKKSFLAILCGEAGEKVELFAGTYRTALGLSRTFILPDSPRSLELQLQGDDLVEVFLVFAQNVFGLEPATVRVREVRIGRAERRAARRRAREARGQVEGAGAAGEGSAAEDTVPAGDIQHGETIVTTVVSVGDAIVDPTLPQLRRTTSRPRRSVAGFVSSGGANGSTLNGVIERGRERDVPVADGSRSNSPTPANVTTTAVAAVTTSTATAYVPPPEELAALAAVAQFGPYTTFQQLTFAPKFPLGTIADDYIIPPTYDKFMDYRRTYEPTAPEIGDLMTSSESPAVLGPPAPPPPPIPQTAPKWYYVDPKGVLQGPWKTSLMQSWFVDGFLPSDLPVRREYETTFIMLKELVARAEDRDKPFHTPLVTPAASTTNLPNIIQPSRLLKPISLLAQPKHFGPPALFFSSRGGHSTTIVDSRGKSVLRGRLNWSTDEGGKLGDVRRLEAFDARGRAVVVALRQGGLEAVDIGDALLQPADESRAALPSFQPNPIGVARRPTFVWKIGNSIEPLAQLLPIESPFSSTHPSTKRFMSPLGRTKSGTGTPNHHSSRPSTKGAGDINGVDDADGTLDEELIYLGRHEDKIYICERTPSTFRILNLGIPSQ